MNAFSMSEYWGTPRIAHVEIGSLLGRDISDLGINPKSVGSTLEQVRVTLPAL